MNRIVPTIATAAAFISTGSQPVRNSPSTPSNTVALTKKSAGGSSLAVPNRAALRPADMRGPLVTARTSPLHAGVDPELFAYGKVAVDIVLGAVSIAGAYRIKDRVNNATNNTLAGLAVDVLAAGAIVFSVNAVGDDINLVKFVGDDFNRATIESVRGQEDPGMMSMSSESRASSSISDQALSSALKDIKPLN